MLKNTEVELLYHDWEQHNDCCCILNSDRRKQWTFVQLNYILELTLLGHYFSNQTCVILKIRVSIENIFFSTKFLIFKVDQTTMNVWLSYWSTISIQWRPNQVIFGWSISFIDLKLHWSQCLSFNVNQINFWFSLLPYTQVSLSYPLAVGYFRGERRSSKLVDLLVWRWLTYDG